MALYHSTVSKEGNISQPCDSKWLFLLGIGASLWYFTFQRLAVVSAVDSEHEEVAATRLLCYSTTQLLYQATGMPKQQSQEESLAK